MGSMEIIGRINIGLDNHFKSNKGNWQAEGYVNPDMKDCLSIGWDCLRNTGNIRPAWVALFILKNEPSINYVYYGTYVFTRSTLRMAGYKI